VQAFARGDFANRRLRDLPGRATCLEQATGDADAVQTVGGQHAAGAEGEWRASGVPEEGLQADQMDPLVQRNKPLPVVNSHLA
jgi:hypothetical protein